MFVKGLRVVFLILVLGFPVQVLASEGTFYFGFAPGRAFVDVAGSATGGSLDDEDTGYKIFVGRPLYDFLDLEFAIVDLGQATYSGRALDIFTVGDTVYQFAGDGKARTSMEGISVTGVYTHKLLDDLWLRGQGGLLFWNGELTATNSTLDKPINKSGFGFVLGGGVFWEIVPHLNLRADYELYMAEEKQIGIDGVNMLSAGVVLSF